MPRVSGVDDARNSAVPAVAPQHDASKRAPLLARLTNWIRWPQGPRAIAFGKLLRTTAFKLTLVYLDGVCAVRRITPRLLRIQHAAPDYSSDHAHGECRGHRPHRAIQLGRYTPAGVDRRCACAPARFKPLSRHHLQRRGPGWQRRFTRRRCDGNAGLDRNRVSPARRSGRHRASRAGAGVPAPRRLPPAGRP